MESLAAVGVAANILQFLDFATGVVSSARDLYNSANGATAENHELEVSARHLVDLANGEGFKTLSQRCDQSATKGSKNARAEALEDLSQQCTAIAEDLLGMMYQFRSKSKRKTWESVYKALKAAWKKGDIDRLQQRLDRISAQLHLHMQKKQYEQINQTLQSMQQENVRLEVNRQKDIASLREDFQHLFKILEQRSQQNHETIYSKVQESVQHGIAYSAEFRILDSLRFDTIEHRERAIPQQHQGTFEWIFSTEAAPPESDLPRTTFVDWLRQEKGVFWVSGKPGSGKSTLMKFLSTHETAIQHLQEWAQPRKLVVASFYFWSAAKDELQKSQVGLVRSILYQTLRQRPALIPVAFPQTWQSQKVGEHSPASLTQGNTDDYLEAYRRVLEALESEDISFCLFIDGLDEYNGKPSDIIRLVEMLQDSKNVKTCVASRPWNEFEKIFGADNPWKLAIHELTEGDICLYVQDKLEQNWLFKELKEMDDRYPILVTRLVSAAQGVFLWVFLVVQSLLEGITNADRIVDLQKRLNEIPSDLEDYFERIFLTVDARYQEQMARALKITLHGFYNLPLIGYWLMDEGPNCPLFRNMCSESHETRTAAIVSCLNQANRRMNAQCKGLLQISPAIDEVDPSRVGDQLEEAQKPEVVFMHRTTSDFLGTAKMQLRLQERLRENFDADLELCQCVLGMMKLYTSGTEEEYSSLSMATSLFKLKNILFYHVKLMEKSLSQTKMLELLDKLHQAYLAIGRREGASRMLDISLRLDTWQLMRLKKWQHTKKTSAWLNTCKFRVLADSTRAGLTGFIARELEGLPTLPPASRQEISGMLLTLALTPWGVDWVDWWRPNDEDRAAVVELLLRHGADPNCTDGLYTCWTAYLECRQNSDGAESKRANIYRRCGIDTTVWGEPIYGTYRIIAAMLRHGAQLVDGGFNRWYFGMTEEQFEALQEVAGKSKDGLIWFQGDEAPDVKSQEVIRHQSKIKSWMSFKKRQKE